MVQSALLEVENLSMYFGGVRALDNVSFNVAPNSITALIGPNGAGKTTVFNCLTGFYRASHGGIMMHTRNRSINIGKILGQSFVLDDYCHPKIFFTKLFYKLFGGTHQVNRAGLARTFQNIRLFREMTVLENLLVAQHQSLDRSLLAGVFNITRFRNAERNARKYANAWLEFFDIASDANRLAGELPYGHQRRLEMARAMCTQPKLLCLDEPAAGLNPAETAQLGKIMQRLREQYEVTILLIEHDMQMVMEICEHIVVLDYGKVIADGSPQMIRNNPAVIAAYLGTETT